MKKALILIIMVALAVTSLAALDNFTYGPTNFAFRPTDVRSAAMGQASLTSPGKMEAFYSNPAALAERKFGLQIPSVSVTVYNVQPLLADESIDWKHITEKENLIALGTSLIGKLGRGRNKILSVEASVGLKASIFGLSTNVKVDVHSLRTTGQTADQSVIPEINAAQTLSFGLRVVDFNKMKLDVGVAGHFVYKMYMLAQNANDIISMVSGDSPDFKQYLTATPVMGGWAIPFDFGATLTLLDSVKISATANNINGTYRMKAYGSALGLAEKNGIKIDIGEDYDKTVADAELKITTPMTVNLGFSFDPEVKILDPMIEVDFTDVLGYFKTGKYELGETLKHLNIGAEVHISPVVALRAGAEAGNLRFGAQLNLGILQIDATYGWMELGANWGDKRTDFATIRVNLGSDR